MPNNDEARPVLPYASEPFGVYQPLLGWRSRLAKERVREERRRLIDFVATEMMHDYRYQDRGPGVFPPDNPGPGDPAPAFRSQAMAFAQAAVHNFIHEYGRPPQGKEWAQLLNQDRLNEALAEIVKQRQIMAKADSSMLIGQGVVLYPKTALSAEEFAAIGARPIEGTDLMIVLDNARALQVSLRREMAVASLLHWLSTAHPELVADLVAVARPAWQDVLPFVDPLANYDPNDLNVQAFLAPIGLIHLYRQYFFELETFLGPPVGHVWLSPGGTVELIEVTTRRTLTERFTEFMYETTTRTELATVEQDELSESVQEENQRNTNLGVSASAGVNFGVAHGSASATFSMSSSRRQANESTHRHMRQQSEKLASEIRRNFRTTFRTETEVTDTSSRRYVIQNPTDRLVNYELRRKMRRVGVQVQHIGAQMCWQVYVVDPGAELGVAELVHVAQADDIKPETIPAPNEPAPLQPISETVTKIFRLTQLGPDTDYSSVYVVDPNNRDELVGDEGDSPDKRLPAVQGFLLPAKSNGYTIASVEYANHSGLDHEGGASTNTVSIGEISFEVGRTQTPTELFIRLNRIQPHGFRAIQFTFDILWTPPSSPPVQPKAPTNQERRDLHADYVKAVRERIKFAGDVPQRPAGELRQEERIAVYRRLIEQLMKVGADQKPYVTAELIRAIFDVDSMLYFVAPEWWRPRQRIRQQIAPTAQAQGNLLKQRAEEQLRRREWGLDRTSITTPGPGQQLLAPQAMDRSSAQLTGADKVGWGGVDEANRDNYLITEDSAPAPFGSSLGWLLQLDGDNHRNAFLNAPWVKAVIPIRPGREIAGLNWLAHAGAEGADGLNDPYGSPAEDPRFRNPDGSPRSVREVLVILAGDIQAEAAFDTALAAETVYAMGFDPLEGGFSQNLREDRIFDQWIEVLPTDQVVAVENNLSYESSRE
jgi:hypothetical protein